MPRFTEVSDGNPRRRLLIGSKAVVCVFLGHGDLRRLEGRARYQTNTEVAIAGKGL